MAGTIAGTLVLCDLVSCQDSGGIPGTPKLISAVVSPTRLHSELGMKVHSIQ